MNRTSYWLRVALGAAWCACSLGARADTVTVAVAANFSSTAQKIAADFSRTSGHEVRLVPGATGKLYAQIKNGAPFHILLSADDETPSRLVKEGAALATSQFTYATGRLVLWSAQANVVDSQGHVLNTPFTRLAIADPKTAPYGAAAMEVLAQRGLLPSLQTRLVQGESIAQAYQFVASGNAPLGFVALSQVMRNGHMSEGSAWRVPAELHAPLRQDAVLLQSGVGHLAAMAFLRYLRGDAARAVMQSAGYE
ncbi:MAG: molybdate ABC transporter substrate-binding protein [Rhodoferax sp.]|nr:molybdate ABC transporter substrate-binding protein [Rhodoferax sp.]